ncbi:GyrI-like domain-containing protein [Membranihabitans maritimus]|uniref:GyrI-like domain-containing protein n=1 Tax=Membranihabitans maritimus TaxID=2904244 RepID=UPI001F33BA53|nr:GyrI-like domain-containing protein [Membranihabitans maritimus]
MKYVNIDPFQIIGISIHTTNENGQASSEIAELWNQFMTKGLLRKIPNKIDNTIYSLYTDYEGDHTQPYTALLGCKVNSLGIIPEGMIGRRFGEGKYVKVSAHGDLTEGLIVKQWSKIWRMELDRKYSIDFEVFGDKAQDPTDAEIDFYIAVK